ncbi:hypothetical protein B0J14DRAFT_221135 [Halenospora varia]|nr:hypothetical protein B0J14DRAFT_221135 [Halenospora varia]
MIGLRKFMELFLALELEIELVVWWSNTEYYSYDMARLFQQIDIETSGGAMDSHYERFLTSISVVSRNKEGMSRALSDNRHQRLGFRNVLPIDATDFTLPEETKSKALQKKSPSPSQSNDLPRSFACDICGRKFRYPDNLKKHTRNVHNPVQQQCPHCNGTFKSQDSLQDHILRSCSTVPRDMITCPNAGCSKAMPQNSIHHHIRVNHSQSEQVKEFGDLMGVGEWVLN